MSVAPLQAELLVIGEQKSSIEYDILIMSNRMQTLTYKSGAMMEEYLKKLQKYTDNQDTTDEAANISTFNSEEFQLEYEAATTRLQAQEKQIELTQKNLETKQKALSTEEESVKKQIEKNIQKEFNTSMG